ncbi:hypothetical protein QVD17_02224 [Tagetes erecta]|uniref:Reverse transcriptase zinc-binding domain-containing protein n=1 Tax=Tagetes erecta TaxID=13708 RepID=A0AAD8P8N4_TARER|nr:hypothetical protein QVD17_02224 [Tagetes erecta]
MAKVGPLKIRSFVWRLYQGRVPVTSNLITRGVNIPTVACQLCTLESEDVDHLFVHCPISSQLWKMTSTWLGFPLDAENSIQSVCSKVYNYNGTSLRRKITSLITYSTIWTLWKTRNDWIFTKRAKTIGRLMEEVKLQSFNWINYRSSNLMVSWEIWCKSPAEGVKTDFVFGVGRLICRALVDSRVLWRSAFFQVLVVLASLIVFDFNMLVALEL